MSAFTPTNEILRAILVVNLGSGPTRRDKEEFSVSVTLHEEL